VEVLRFVATGKSNTEIAEKLVLSRRTVERHISNIYSKTDTHGRAEATAFAFIHGLISSSRIT
jgi:DNA-binding NarL/FixJ family response regulator